MLLKIIETNNKNASFVEDVVNSFLEGKDFINVSIQHIVELPSPQIGVRVYILYELVQEPIEV